MKKIVKSGYKCFSMHKIKMEKINLIASEGTQSEQQFFNCMKCKKYDRSKDILG